MSKRDYWNPEDYSIENQLQDIIKGKDVATDDDGVVIRGKDDSHFDVYWPSDSERGHGHGGIDLDEDGNATSELYHK